MGKTSKRGDGRGAIVAGRASLGSKCIELSSSSSSDQRAYLTQRASARCTILNTSAPVASHVTHARRPSNGPRAGAADGRHAPRALPRKLTPKARMRLPVALARPAHYAANA
eukprot:363361-Chlamydomonas_euryale.AAC.9